MVYADDLVLLVPRAKEREVEEKENAAIEQVSMWLNIRGLQLALEKTSVMVMAGQRKL